MFLTRKRRSARVAAVTLIGLLSGCATGTNPSDPFEPVNRGIYQFNEGLDKAILKPIAQGYRFVVPQFVRGSISNFFSNINDVVVMLNNVLQGKFTTAYSDFGRIAMNSTLGIVGLFDIASEAGIEKHDEDFGQTLGYYGVQDGPYLVLPLWGPSTVRDTAGRLVDYYLDPVTYVRPLRARNSAWAVRIVSRRAELLDASSVLETAALDQYEFVRDAYLQRRRSLIYDGNPPPDKDFLDPPAPQKNTSTPSFPSSADVTGAGSTVVSGPAQAPVQATLQEEPKALPATTAAAAVQRAPAWFRQDTVNWYAGERPTPAELDALEQTATGVATAPEKRREPTYLVRLWRSIAP